MKNLEIARILNNIADILELEDVQWKPNAYRKAAQSIESLNEDIKDIYERGELYDIPGVGEHIGKKIEEILKTGKLKYYRKLKKKVKVDIEELRQVPSLGPKKIKLLYKKLGIKNIKDLEKAIKKGKLQKIKGFGEETTKNFQQGIEIVKTRPKRFLYQTALPIVEEIKENLKKLRSVQKVEVAGSFRRCKETVGDLDFLVVSKKPEEVMKMFTSMADVKKVLAKGSTKSSVRLTNNLQIDLRVVKEKEFGSALLYFIGNKQHNVEIRKLALKKGYTLSEYGLFKVKGKRWVAGRTEEDIYKKLGLKYMEPELRENLGELTAARQDKLPKLITKKDVKGIFHNHTTWSDGGNSILEMAKKAEELKLKFFSFNDHFGPVGIANPLNERRLKGYIKEIDKVQKKVGIKIFKGLEIDILKDGKLPLSSKKLKELDVVIASVHLAIKMDEKEMTKRVCYALENYPVNILGHPTDRLLGTRQPLNINLEKVFECAKKNNVFMEINGSPKRMDLSGENVKDALEKGCRFALGSDAHSVDHLPFYTLSINMARRGWTEKKNVLNCWTLPKIEKALKG